MLLKANVRPASQADWLAVRQVLWSAGLLTDDLDAIAWRYFLVSLNTFTNSIVGAIALEPLTGDVALLRSLAVRAEARRKGIGRELVSRVEAHARDLSVQNICLLTTDAESFFGACGYRCIARESAPVGVRSHVQFQSLCPASAVLMIKTLHG